MPAKLPYATVKTDIRLIKADVEFLTPYLDDRNWTITELARELVHRYANKVREDTGLRPVPPHPPGRLP